MERPRASKGPVETGLVQGPRTEEKTGLGSAEARDDKRQAPRHSPKEAAEGQPRLERLEAASRTDGLVASTIVRDGAVWSGLRWEDPENASEWV